MYVMSYTPVVLVSIKICKEVEVSIRSGLIKRLKIKGNTPLMHTEARQMFGLCAETKETGIFLLSTTYLE